MNASPAAPRRLWLWLAAGVLALLVIGGGVLGLRLFQANTPKPTPTAAPTPAVEPGFVTAGQAALQASQWAQAETAFSQALGVQPPESRQHVLEATLGRAEARYHLNEYAGALEDFAAVQQLDSSRPEPDHYRTEILWAEGDLAGAVAAGQAALTHEPAFGLPYALQALQAYQKQDETAALAAANAAIDRDPSLVLAYRVRGSLYAWQYDFDHAWDDLSTAIAKAPDDGEALAMRVYVAFQRGDAAAALKDAALAAQTAPRAPGVLWAQAEVKLYQYDFGGAQSLIRQAIALDPQRPEFFITQGASYTLTADAPLALASFQQALSLRPDFVLGISAVAFWHTDRWEYDTEAADAQHLIALNPRAPDGYVLQANSDRRLHQTEAELKDAQQLLALFPRLPYGYSARARYELERHDEALAQADFQHVVDLDPQATEGYLGLALVSLDQRQYDLAAHALDQWQKISASSRLALDLRSTIALSLGKEADAWTAVKAALAFDPQDPEILVSRAQLSSLDGDYKSALADLTSVVQAFPGYVYAYTTRGRTYLSNNQYAEAVQDGTRALRRDPNDPDAYMVLALAAASKNDWSGVLSHTDKVIALDDHRAEAYQLRGQANIRLGKYAAAIPDFRQVTILEPGFYQAFASLAEALYQTGDIRGAIESARAALEYTRDVNAVSQLETTVAFYESIPPVIDGLRSVADTDNGYQVAYTPEWLQLAPSSTNTAVVLRLTPVKPVPAVYVTVYRIPLKANTSLTAWAGSVDKTYAGNSHFYKSMSLKPARVGNVNGLVRDYRDSTKIGGDDVTVTGRDYYVVAHGIGWLVQFDAPATRFDDYAQAVAAMAASFVTR